MFFNLHGSFVNFNAEDNVAQVIQNGWGAGGLISQHFIDKTTPTSYPGWLVVGPPLWKRLESVNWEDDIPNIHGKTIHMATKPPSCHICTTKINPKTPSILDEILLPRCAPCRLAVGSNNRCWVRRCLAITIWWFPENIGVPLINGISRWDFPWTKPSISRWDFLPNKNHPAIGVPPWLWTPPI